MRHGAGDSSKQDDAFLVGYRSDRADEFRGGCRAKKTDQERTNFSAPHAAESASGCRSNMRVQVIKKITEQRNRFRQRVRAPARIRASLRVVMTQERQRGAGRKWGLELCGGSDGPLQTWPLNHPLGDQPNERLCRIRAADAGQSLDRGGLFGHDPISAKTREAQ